MMVRAAEEIVPIRPRNNHRGSSSDEPLAPSKRGTFLGRWPLTHRPSSPACFAQQFLRRTGSMLDRRRFLKTALVLGVGAITARCPVSTRASKYAARQRQPSSRSTRKSWPEVPGGTSWAGRTTGLSSVKAAIPSRLNASCSSLRRCSRSPARVKIVRSASESAGRRNAGVTVSGPLSPCPRRSSTCWSRSRIVWRNTTTRPTGPRNGPPDWCAAKQWQPAIWLRGAA